SLYCLHECVDIAEECVVASVLRRSTGDVVCRLEKVLQIMSAEAGVEHTDASSANVSLSDVEDLAPLSISRVFTRMARLISQ
ncbi:hypothetical protein SOVF_216060, partial [Spinacia oleracea]